MAIDVGGPAGLDEVPRPARTPLAERTHRVHCFAGRAHDVLDDLVGSDGAKPVAMSELSAFATRESLIELSRLQSRIDGLKVQLLDHAEAVGVHVDPDPEDGPVTRPLPATSTAGWYAAAANLPRPVAKHEVKVAQRLEDFFHCTSRALAAGHLSRAHAQVIVEAVDSLPACEGEAKRHEGEAYLVEQAAQHDVPTLRRMARYLVEVIDPEGADELLAKQLADEEERAARKTFLSMRDDGKGTVHGQFAVPGHVADMLRVALMAISSPRRPGALERQAADDSGAVTEVPNDVLMGQAFCEYVERFPAAALPTSGGINATVLVTMQLETLLGGIAPATLDTGRKVTAETARRLASQCGVIPAVFDSEGVLLDLGRTVRLHTKAQRIALRAKHRTCTVEGCSVPAAYCHAHHKKPWASGGRTSVKDGTLLCPSHHRHAHRPGYQVSYDGDVTRITKSVKRRQ